MDQGGQRQSEFLLGDGPKQTETARIFKYLETDLDVPKLPEILMVGKPRETETARIFTWRQTKAPGLGGLILVCFILSRFAVICLSLSEAEYI